MFDKNEPEDILSAVDKEAPKPEPPTAPAPAPEVSAPEALAAEPVAPAPAPEQPAPAEPVVESVPESVPAPAALPTPPSTELPVVPKNTGKILIIIIAVVVVVAAAGIAYWALSGEKEDVVDVIMPEDVSIDIVEDDIEPEPEEEDDDEVITPTPEPATTVDTDRDGLSDLQEAEIGTNIRVADTDADGLSDYEEVTTWQTDPLDPDTDGDSFVDGSEVDAGYDPNGDGKLTEIPDQE